MISIPCAALIPVVICYLARWYLDRGRTEPPWIFPALSVLGGLGGVFALYVGPELEQWIEIQALSEETHF